MHTDLNLFPQLVCASSVQIDSHPYVFQSFDGPEGASESELDSWNITVLECGRSRYYPDIILKQLFHMGAY